MARSGPPKKLLKGGCWGVRMLVVALFWVAERMPLWRFFRWQRDGLFPYQILVFVSPLIADPLKISPF